MIVFEKSETIVWKYAEINFFGKIIAGRITGFEEISTSGGIFDVKIEGVWCRTRVEDCLLMSEVPRKLA